MTIIHIIQFLTWGGVGSVVYDLSVELVKKGQDVYIISLFDPPNKEYEKDIITWCEKRGVKIIRLHSSGTIKNVKVFGLLRKQIKLLKSKENIKILMHLKWGVLSGVTSTLLLKDITRIEVYHSHYSRYKLLSLCMKPFIHKYIGVSISASEELTNKFHINKAKVNQIYNGVDVDHIRKHNKDMQINSNHLFKFMSIGRLSYEKGFRYAIDAFNLILKNSMRNDLEYVIIGEGPEKQDYERIISSHYVTMLGKSSREDVYKNIIKSNAIILPSLWEGNSILLLEVLSIGRPVIITDIESFREVFDLDPLRKHEDYRIFDCGVLVHPQNPNSLMKGIYAILDHKEMLEQMNINAQMLASNFTIQKQADKYIEYLSR